MGVYEKRLCQQLKRLHRNASMDDDIIDAHCDPKEPRAITFEQVTTADLLLADGVAKTPCASAVNSCEYNMDLYFKMEFMQRTGSFKERGARLALLLLTKEQKEIGVISASTGNHAMALSYHGNLLNIPITVVVPTSTSTATVDKCRSYNATVIVEGRDISESRVIALVFAKEQQLEYINGYDHPDVIAGCGTIGFEILRQVPKINAVVVPVGGGGLIAGIATIIKTVSPATKVIGVELEKCPSFMRAMRNGSRTYTPPNSSLAESLLVPIVGSNALAMSRNLIDKLVLVREVWVAVAMLRLVEEEGCMVEGAGAVGLAAVLSGQLRELERKRVVVLLTGCNTSVKLFGQALERGLAAERRLLKADCDCSRHERRVHELFEKLSPLGLNTDELLSGCVWLKRVYSWEKEYSYMPCTTKLLSLVKLKKETEESAKKGIKEETPREIKEEIQREVKDTQKKVKDEKIVNQQQSDEKEPNKEEPQKAKEHQKQHQHKQNDKAQLESIPEQPEEVERKFKRFPATYRKKIFSRKHTI